MKKIITLPLVVALLLSIVIHRPARAEASLLTVIGPIVGAPVGGVFGLLRGAGSKGVDYAESFPGEMGDNILGKIIGTPVGLIVGMATGGVTGLAKGVIDGVVIGIDDPLSADSTSLSGDFLDYDPYDVTGSLD